MRNLFLYLFLFLFFKSISYAEFRLVPTNCTKKKIENCGAYLYDDKSGTTYFCTSEKCTEIQEALAAYEGEVKGTGGKKESKKSKIPKFGTKKKEKKSKIPKFKKSN
tara:strand:+ start:390 stop:710 length:321 start_codon:yes stop_codon:yes gene_type:complete